VKGSHFKFHKKNDEARHMGLKVWWYILSVSTYRMIVANFDRSKRCAASAADTIAPSKADKSQISSVTKNLRAKLKNAVGPLLALTAIT
jgi:hypothetical protein